MKYRLLPLVLSIALVSCTPTERIDATGEPMKIDPTKPPDGMRLVQILLENLAVPLKGTGCGNGPNDPSVLKDHLAMFLGDGFDSPLVRTELSSDCQPDRYDLPSGGKIDAWHCRLGVVLKADKADKDELGVSGSIHFGVTKDTWEFVPVPEALVCL